MLINYINAQFFNIRIWDSVQLSVTLIFGKKKKKKKELNSVQELYNNMHHMQKTAMKLKLTPN